jgi:DNA-binding CsgD family transcriptional regulator
MDKTSPSKKPGIIDRQDQEISFTELETQCVLQLMQNKTAAHIGVDLGLSENTVRFYLMNAGQKLRLSGKNRP